MCFTIACMQIHWALCFENVAEDEEIGIDQLNCFVWYPAWECRHLHVFHRYSSWHRDDTKTFVCISSSRIGRIFGEIICVSWRACWQSLRNCLRIFWFNTDFEIKSQYAHNNSDCVQFIAFMNLAISRQVVESAYWRDHMPPYLYGQDSR